MAKRAAKATRASVKASDRTVDYTVPGLIVLVAIVLITALFYAQSNVALSATNLGTGKAYDTGSADATPKVCDVSSYCDGSRLLRQGSDCQQYVAYCTYGCVLDAKGNAVCSS